MSFADVIKNLDWSYLTDLLISVIPAVVCMTVHELCHGLAALAMGDDTAETHKRLSLNPLRHIDPVGLIMLEVFKVGWAKPVPVNMMNFRHPKRGMAITALAGPASNLVLACVVLFLRGLITLPLAKLSWGAEVLQLFDTTAYLSICLGLFNLIPIPPMDGSKVLFALLPDRIYMQLMRYEKYGMLLVLLVMLSGTVTAKLNDAAYFIFDKLFVIARAGFDLVNLL